MKHGGRRADNTDIIVKQYSQSEKFTLKQESEKFHRKNRQKIESKWYSVLKGRTGNSAKG